jgi:hypothetical protein
MRCALVATLAIGGALAVGTPTAHALSGTTSFSFTSAPGDYIGQGLSESFDSSSATFTTGGYASVGATAGSLWVTVTTPTENWQVMLLPPAGQQLHPGTYQNALRAPFNGSSPGLSVSGDGRGCNNDYGSFTVYQLGFASNGSLTQLDADFTQMCESTTAPPLQGTVKYQASPRSSVALGTSVVLSHPGEPVTLTATVAAQGAGTPTGTVTFSDGNRQVGTATLDSTGTGAITTSFGTAGVHTLIASYSGDSTHAAATSAPATENVEASATSTTTWYTYSSVAGDYIGQGATASYGPSEATFRLSGSTTSATFAVTAGSESWTVQLTAPSGQTLAPGSYGGGGFATGLVNVFGDGRGQTEYGNFTITSIGWDASGNLNELEASFTASGSTTGQDPLQGVVDGNAPLPATSTALSASPTSLHPGQSTTLTATVTSANSPAPTGTVTFSQGTAVLGTGSLNAAGQATLTVSFPALGTDVVTATYAGDAAHAGSTSAPVTLTVQNPTTTTLSASPLQPKRGKPVTLTAQVTSQDGAVPTGTVTFTDNGKVLAAVQLDGTGHAVDVATFSAGNQSIVAQYGGDSTDQASTSSTVVVSAH